MQVSPANLFLPLYLTIWLVGCFGFNDPFRHYFILYRDVTQREGEREKGQMRVKLSKLPPPCESSRPLPYGIQIVGRPGIGTLLSTTGPPLVSNKNNTKITTLHILNHQRTKTENPPWDDQK